MERRRRQRSGSGLSRTRLDISDPCELPGERWYGVGSLLDRNQQLLCRLPPKGETFGYDEVQRDKFALVRWRDYEFYGGDAFKVSRRVTLNYGARWSMIRAPYLDDNRLAGFSPVVYAAESGFPANDPCRGMVLAKGARAPALLSAPSLRHPSSRTAR